MSRTLLLLLLAPLASAADPKPHVDAEGFPLPTEAARRFGPAKFSDGPHSWASFSPDGKRVVTTLHQTGKTEEQRRSGVAAWEVSTGRRLWLAAEGFRCLNATVHVDGKSVWVYADKKSGEDGRSNVLFRLSMADGQELGKRQVGTEYSGETVLTPDGWLAVLWNNGGRRPPTVGVFDATGKAVLEYKAEEDHRFEHLRLSPDKRVLFLTGYGARGDDREFLRTFGQPKRLLALSVETGKPLWVRDTSPIASVVVSPDGERVITHGGNAVRAWNVETGKEVASATIEGLDRHRPFARPALSLNPDGKTLLLRRTDDGTLPLDSTTLKPGTPIAAPLHAAWWTADGKVGAVPTGRNLTLYDASGKPLPQSPSPLLVGYKHQLAITTDGKRVVRTAGPENHVEWDLATGREVRRVKWAAFTREGTPGMPAFQTPVDVPAARSPDGTRTLRFLHGEEAKGKLRISLFERGQERELMPLPENAVMFYELGFSPDGRYAYAINHAQQLYTWNLRDGGPETEIEFNKRRAENFRGAGTLHPSPDGRRYALIERNQYPFDNEAKMNGWCIGVYEWADDKRVGEFVGNGTLWGLSWSVDGTRIGGGGQSGSTEKSKGFAFAGSVPDGRFVMAPTDLPDRALAAALSSDGNTVAVGNGGEVFLYEVCSRRLRHKFTQAHREVVTVGFTLDGKHLLAESTDGSIFLWDVRGDLTKPAKRDAVGWDAAWKALGGEDATAAFRAVRLFALYPDEGSMELKQRFAESKPPSDEAIAALVKRLDDRDFKTRDQALKELKAIGFAAHSALKKALDGNPSEELRTRASELLAVAVPPDLLRAERAVEAMTLADTVDAKKLIDEWAKGPTSDPFTMAAKRGSK
jgi:WD40 repeat protein